MDQNEQFIRSEFYASATVLQQTAAASCASIAQAAALLAGRLAAGGKLLVFGNGGSAADAQHLAAELVGRYRRERRALAALALTTDTSLLTAVGNDYSFEQIFARQVEALAQPGDVVLGISTSGRSPNVVAGLAAARQRQAHTLALVGPQAEASLADLVIRVPSQDTARIQESHAVIIHILCDLVEKSLSEQVGAGDQA
jgi:D-sedoheptulose 7-phosphate isomerase